MAQPSSGSGPRDNITLQSVLSDSRTSLLIMKDKRMALQQNIQHKFHDINQTTTDYWVTQAKSLTDHTDPLGCDIDEVKWRVEFATPEILRAEAAAAKQKQLWSEIEEMVKEAKDRDDTFWATWRTSLDHLACPDQSTQQLSLPSEAAKGSLRKQNREERPFQPTTKHAVARGPTACAAKKPKPKFKPAVFSSSSSPTNPARNVTNDTSFNPSHVSPSSDHLSTTSTPKETSDPATRETTRDARTERPARKAATKTSAISAPLKANKPVKKYTIQSSAKSPFNPHPVTDPTSGQLYQAYYHSPNAKERGWYMGTVLPWKSSDWAEETMINFSMQDMDLLSDWPDCCEPGVQTKTMLVDGKLVETKELTCIEKWSPGFEDGGPRVMDRQFLFLFFEDRPNRLGCLNIDPTEPMKPIKFGPSAGEPVPIDWVQARYLRMNNNDDSVVWGSVTAESYRNKLDTVARKREQQTRAASGSQVQSPPKRTVGKRPLGSDDEYDEGLGMDHDLSLKKSTTPMSRPQTSLMGLPPQKLPRLDDYNIPGLSAGGSGFRTPSAYMNADVSKSRRASSAIVPIPSPSKYEITRDVKTEPDYPGNYSHHAKFSETRV